jgi:hypothetical protein
MGKETLAFVRVEGVSPVNRARVALSIAVETLTFIRDRDGRDFALALWNSVREQVWGHNEIVKR